MRKQGVRGVLLSAVIGLLATGCLNTRNGPPIKPGQKPLILTQQRVPGMNGQVPDNWRRVFVGEIATRPRLEGYMRTAVTPHDDHKLVLHWVYDSQFQLVGVMTDVGKTTRYNRKGEPSYLGTLATDQGLLALLGHDKLEPIHLVDMPAPAE